LSNIGAAGQGSAMGRGRVPKTHLTKRKEREECGWWGRGWCKGRVVEWIHPLSVSLHLSLNICILI